MNVRGYECQKVCGAEDKQIIVTATDLPWDKRSLDISSITGTVLPEGITNGRAVQLSFCYYQKMESGSYTIFK